MCYLSIDAANDCICVGRCRITDLLLQVTEMQATVATSRASELAMKQQMDQMAADVADTIATIGASANGRSLRIQIHREDNLLKEL